MNHIGNTAILVECGFLTNPEEEKLLQQESYQRKVALVLGSTLTEII
jgi:N-acetylmuramoyl-L-alanine amidase